LAETVMAAMAAVVKSMVFTLVVLVTESKKYGPSRPQERAPGGLLPATEVQPIIAGNEQPFSMFQDLWSKHRGRVFDPIQYSSIDKLVEMLDTQIIARAEARFNELVLRRAQTMPIR
jgi:hypothetical protein